MSHFRHIIAHRLLPREVLFSARGQHTRSESHKMFALLGLISFATSQNATGPAPEGFFGQVQGYVKEIETGAADACSNNYITGPYLEGVLCGTLVPSAIISALPIHIAFGANTTWCAALACAYRAMGCAQPTYRVEADIVKATGAAEPDCASSLGIPAADCDLFAKFIAKNPNAAPLGKRSLATEMKIETPIAAKRVEDLTEAEKREAEVMAATVVRAYYPGQHFPGLDERVPPISLKRDAGTQILDNLQICSPLIALGISLLASEVTLPINITDIVGPCGFACNVALCALNLLCADEAAPLLVSVGSMRSGSGCGPLQECASFAAAPPSVCANVTCAQPDTYFTVNTCPPPSTIHVPSKASVTDCCTTCKNVCATVNCPALTSCPAPVWPLCSKISIAKHDPYDCCSQCIDPCYGKTSVCPAAPTSCPPGSIVGPSHPGDCCLSCQPKCAGIDCSGTPMSASQCTAGQTFVAPKNGQNDNPAQCSDCCGACVANSSPIVGSLKGSASSLVVGVCAVVVVLLAMLL